MDEEYLVRLKPYDPNAVPPMPRDYTAAPWGIKYREGLWYPATKEVADYLCKVTRSYERPNSPLAFDVLLRTEAETLQAQEEAAELGLIEGPGEPAPLMPQIDSLDAEALAKPADTSLEKTPMKAAPSSAAATRAI